MKTSETIVAIAPALVKAQAAMQAAAKSATNPHFKSKYADLATVIDAVKGPLIANGIMFMQSPTNDSTGVQVTTRFQHESGEYIEDTIYLPVPQQTPQAYGSAITYGKRYGLQSLTGLPSEDDDGQAASAPAEPKPNTARQVAVDAFDSMPDDEKKFLQGKATELIALVESDQGDVAGFLDGLHLQSEEKLALWSLLPSQIRTAIKKAQEADKASKPRKPTPSELAMQA